MEKMICFDMDGTIADLYGVREWLEKLRNNDASPYKEAEPLCDMNRLCAVLHNAQRNGWKICVISWFAIGANIQYKNETKRAKLEWLKQYNFPFDEAHFTRYGATKADSVRKKVEYAILIDDNDKVRRGWTLGATINPKEENIIDALERAIF